MKKSQEINRALLTAQYEAAGVERIREALGPAEVVALAADDKEGIARALTVVDVAFLASDLDDRFVGAPRLKWVHCGHAGIEGSARREMLARGVIVTGSAGRSSPVLAEHVLFLMLSLVYDSRGLFEAQAAHRWGVAGYEDRRGLFGKTVGIIGVGATGSELAKRVTALDMHVIGFRRRAVLSPHVDRLLVADDGDTIDPLLQESDFVVVCTSLSDETYHLLGPHQLGLMKPSAYLINIARGDVVDEDALLCALQSSKIAGAGLDNFSTEPLPEESALWGMRNVVITPHMTPRMPDRTGRTLDILCENIRRYRLGEPLLNALEERDAYGGGAQ